MLVLWTHFRALTPNAHKTSMYAMHVYGTHDNPNVCTCVFFSERVSTLTLAQLLNLSENSTAAAMFACSGAAKIIRLPKSELCG